MRPTNHYNFMMLLIIGVCNVFVMHFESEPVVVVPAED
jgi:hypothetical protein